MTHKTVVDESQSADNGGTMFAAFCNDPCTWASRWHHSDEYTDRTDRHPDDLAFEAAEAEGKQHEEES